MRIIEQTSDRFRGTHKGTEIEIVRTADVGSVFKMRVEHGEGTSVDFVKGWMDDAKRKARFIADVVTSRNA
jgi:hypothetical protein